MSLKASQLRARREALLCRSAAERLEWRSHLEEIEGVFAGVDRGVRILRRVATPPVLLAGGVLAALLLGRSRSQKLLLGGLALASRLAFRRLGLRRLGLRWLDPGQLVRRSR